AASFLKDEEQHSQTERRSTHQTDNRSSPTGETEEPEKRKLLIESLNKVVAGHELVKKASEKDIVGEVFMGGILFSLIFGGIALIVIESNTELKSSNTGLILLAILAAFLLVYWKSSTDKNYGIQKAMEDLGASIRNTADAFPKSVYAWGGPEVLKDVEGI